MIVNIQVNRVDKDALVRQYRWLLYNEQKHSAAYQGLLNLIETMIDIADGRTTNDGHIVS